MLPYEFRIEYGENGVLIEDFKNLGWAINIERLLLPEIEEACNAIDICVGDNYCLNWRVPCTIGVR